MHIYRKGERVRPRISGVPSVHGPGFTSYGGQRGRWFPPGSLGLTTRIAPTSVPPVQSGGSRIGQVPKRQGGGLLETWEGDDLRVNPPSEWQSLVSILRPLAPEADALSTRVSRRREREGERGSEGERESERESTGPKAARDIGFVSSSRGAPHSRERLWHGLTDMRSAPLR